MIRANEARLAQHSAERASRNWTPQALPFDGARGGVAKRARAFIDGHFREPVRMADLCRATGVGLRTLQRCFKQCFGVTVTDYLKTMRLDAAYRDLIAAHPSRDTVTTIALRNGCRHLGRFSSEFRERFGQQPRETLRSEPSAFGQLRGRVHCQFLDDRTRSDDDSFDNTSPLYPSRRPGLRRFGKEPEHRQNTQSKNGENGFRLRNITSGY
jgi:AraC-like DNA-binding protein